MLLKNPQTTKKKIPLLDSFSIDGMLMGLRILGFWFFNYVRVSLFKVRVFQQGLMLLLSDLCLSWFLSVNDRMNLMLSQGFWILGFPVLEIVVEGKF